MTSKGKSYPTFLHKEGVKSKGGRQERRRCARAEDGDDAVRLRLTTSCDPRLRGMTSKGKPSPTLLQKERVKSKGGSQERRRCARAEDGDDAVRLRLTTSYDPRLRGDDGQSQQRRDGVQA